MQKLIYTFLVIGAVSLSSWAHSSTGITEGTVLGRVVGEAVAKQTQITRDDKDFRILYFLGQTYKMYIGNPTAVSYYSSQGDGIVISKQQAPIESVLYEGQEALNKEKYTVKSQDGRNSADVIYSVYKKTAKGIKYKVVRLFPIGNNTTLQVVVGVTITQKDPLPIMRRVMNGVRATPQQVLNAGFPKSFCEFGDDCY